jgi:vesicle transport through interaction with t-SNAREs protein 1
MSDDARERLLDQYERMEAATLRLEQSKRLAESTVDVGATILDNLGTQRESILRSSRQVEEADVNIENSSRHLNVMARRMQTNWCLLTAIIACILTIVALIIYLSVPKN